MLKIHANLLNISVVGLFLLLLSCNSNQIDRALLPLPSNNTRVWIGPQYWANPLQDWQLNNGQIECITSGGLRNIFILTKEIGAQAGDFSMNVKVKNINTPQDSLSEGWIGFEIGIQGEFNDYRDNAVRGRGFPVGITTGGELFIGKLDEERKADADISLEELVIDIQALEQTNGKYSIVLNVEDINGRAYSIKRENIPEDWIEGGVAIVCHSGALIGFPDERKKVSYPNWGMAEGTKRGGNVRFGFSDLLISGAKVSRYEERAYGPILFAQYTLGENELNLTAQMPPVGDKDGQEVEFQIEKDQQWETISKATIHPLARTAEFKIPNWANSHDIPYRLAYQLYDADNKLKYYYYEGVIGREPFDKEEFVIAAFTGNNDLGFPNTDIVKNVNYHHPDFLFFSGDQIYEGVGGYDVQRSPLKESVLDYLRKWYLFGWAYGDLLRRIPSIAIPDDHDVYHGNIWGAGGKATPKGKSGAAAQDMGGYKMPAEWVNMVQRTQTSHFPLPYDATPVKQNIGVYYTDLNYAGVSFAIIEDRKFKSAPKTLLPEAEIYNGWAQNKEFDAAKESDVKGAALLGGRQEKFLEDWSHHWNDDIYMKVLLSQTIFANVATLPEPDSHSDNIVPRLRVLHKDEYPPDDVPVADFDANAWPQTGRNTAVKTIRKAFAFHIAGDQHLGSVIQYGVDDSQDASYAFCVPSISNVWPRRWYPMEGGGGAKDMPRYTGDFKDGFGNIMRVLAVSNPVFTGKKPARLYDRATGYGIVRLNKQTRDITMECWPRLADPKTDNQYKGWPITINQLDNFAQNRQWYLAEVRITGLENPLIQLVNELNHEIVSTIRIKGNTYMPKVLKDGRYSIIVSGKGMVKVLNHISAEMHKSKEVIHVDFNLKIP